MDFLAVIEAIGFDFALIGTLTSLVTAICAYLVFRPRASVGRVGFAAIAFLRRRVRNGKVPEMVFLGALVAVVGMTINIVADQTFDNDRLPFVQSHDDETGSPEEREQKTKAFSTEKCRVETFEWSGWQFVQEEDAIKQDAARSVCARTGENSPARAYMTTYTTATRAKVLAQEANASVLKLNNNALSTALRIEFLAVKIARVIALCAAAVLVISLARSLAAVLQLSLCALIAFVVRAKKLLRRWLAAAPEAAAAGVATDSPIGVLATLRRQVESFPDDLAHHLELGHSAGRPLTSSLWPTLRVTAANVLDVRYELRQLTTLAVMSVFAGGVLVLGIWIREAQTDTYYKKLFYAHLEAKGLDSRPVPIPPESIEFANDALQALGPTTVAEFMNINPQDGSANHFEFSGVTSFAGQTFVVDNETQPIESRGETQANALFVVNFNAGNGQAVTLDVQRPGAGDFPAIGNWDDIEALANDGRYLYAVGSHSLSSVGLLRRNRHGLLRLQPASTTNGRPEIVAYDGIYEGLLGIAARLGLQESAAAEAAGQPSVRVLRDLNIEGLEVALRGGTKDLLLGLRSPLVPSTDAGSDRAVVLRLHDVDGLFGRKGQKARISEEARLDLHGRGIAALEWDSLSGGYLVAAAPRTDAARLDYSSLWLWRPRSPTYELKEIVRFRNHKLEGIARLQWNGKPALLLAFDEERFAFRAGKRVARQFGQLMLVEHGSFK